MTVVRVQLSMLPGSSSTAPKGPSCSASLRWTHTELHEKRAPKSRGCLHAPPATPPAAHLHPIANADQVGHILRAAASAARVAELNAGNDPEVGNMLIDQARQRATPVLVDVLSRYPSARAANDRVAQLMSTLDTALRAAR